MPNPYQTLGNAPITDDTDYLTEEIQFDIDSNMRTIAVPTEGVVIGVQGDKNVNRVNFRMPAWYNGFDMSTFQPRINFVDPEGNVNYYTVTDMKIYDPEGNEVTDTPTTEDIIYFTWLVDSYATNYVGTVVFNVRFTKFNPTTNTLAQAFNTTKAACQVLEGITLADEITQEQQEDLLFHMTAELQDVTDSLKLDLEAKRDEMLDTIPDNYTTLTTRVSALESENGKTLIFTDSDTYTSLGYITKTLTIQKGKRYAVDIQLADDNMSSIPGSDKTLAFSLIKADNSEVNLFTYAGSGLYQFVSEYDVPKIIYGMVPGDYSVNIYEYENCGLIRLGSSTYGGLIYDEYTTTVTDGEQIVVDVTSINVTDEPLTVFLVYGSGSSQTTTLVGFIYENGRHTFVAKGIGSKITVGGAGCTCTYTIYKSNYVNALSKQMLYAIDGSRLTNYSDVQTHNAYSLATNTSAITVYRDYEAGYGYKTIQYPIQNGRAYCITSKPSSEIYTSIVSVFVTDYNNVEKRIVSIPQTGVETIWIADGDYKQINIGYYRPTPADTSLVEFKELDSINGKLIVSHLQSVSIFTYITISATLYANHKYTAIYDFDDTQLPNVPGDGTLGLFGTGASSTEHRLAIFSAPGRATIIPTETVTSLSLGVIPGALRLRVIDEGINTIGDFENTTSEDSSYVTVGSSGCTFTKFTDAVKYAQTHANTTIKVTPGIYDITSETNIASESGGLGIGNGVHIIGSVGAVIMCNYTGGNAGVQEAFSVLNAQPSDFTLEDLDIQAYNVRYCVHDECSGTTSSYTHKYINCRMYHDSHNAQWHTPQCIGGGHGTNGTIIIEGGTYECYPTSGMGPGEVAVNSPLSWHYNTGNKDAYNIFIVKDVYLKGDGAFMYYGGGAATDQPCTSVYISGCNFGSEPVNYSSKDAVGQTSTASLVEWNNHIRDDG